MCDRYCFGCEMKHASPIYHDCVTMGDSQKWFDYSGVSIKNINNERNIWKGFMEALRVLELRCHIDILDYFSKLKETPNILYSLWQSRYNQVEHPELECLLTHLDNWRNN